MKPQHKKQPTEHPLTILHTSELIGVMGGLDGYGDAPQLPGHISTPQAPVGPPKK